MITYPAARWPGLRSATRRCGVLLLCVGMMTAGCSGGSSANSLGTHTKGVVRVAITPVMPYIGQRGDTLAGLNGEIFDEVARRLDLRIEPVQGDFPSLLSNVQSGRVDIGVANIIWTRQRAGSALFTDPLYYSPTVLAERDGVNLTTIQSLSGHTIGTSSNAAYLPGLKKIPHAHVSVFPTPADLFSELSSGRIDVAAMDFLTAYYAKTKRPDLKFHQVALAPPTDAELHATPEYQSLEPTMTCYYVNTKAKALQKKIDAVIRDLYSSGFMTKEITKWGGDPEVMLTLDPSATKRFAADRNGVDRAAGWQPPTIG